MLGFPLNGLATGLRLVRLVLLVPVGHPVEQEVIGVAHRLCGRFSSSFGVLCLWFCSLVLQGFYEDLEVKALINVDFRGAF